MPRPCPTDTDARSAPVDGASPAGRTWRLFCRVIDNHGDLGVCWRLARALADRGERVRLQVDDARALAWMAPGGHPGVDVRPWDDLSDIAADVVVEAFACEVPEDWTRRRLAHGPWPVWINLEYLSAEDWVERVHGLASPRWQPDGRRLDAWFLHPGFSPRTGGLILEDDTRTWMREDAARGTARATPAAIRVFCYDQPAFGEWLSAWRAAGARVGLTPGFATAQARAWLATHPTADADGLDWLDPVPQPGFDALLRAGDFNVVRGEDSLVRAVWSRRPFVWHAYVQADGAQHDKIEAFLDRYLEGAPPAVAARVRAWHRAWNADRADEAGPPAWPDEAGWRAWRDWAGERADAWARELPELVTSLRGFVDTRVAALAG
jgi:uncharacterized repeat protein (TIGR03837 family)